MVENKLSKVSFGIIVTAGKHMGGTNIEKNLRVSIITPDFSHNCVGRAYMLAELIKPHAEVEIIGPAFEGFVWKPVARVPHGISYRYVQCSKKRFFFSAALRLSNMVKGDVIIISKPVLPSMFLGLFAIMRRRAGLIIDIDDGEVGFEIDRFLSGGSLQKLVSFINIFKLMICDLVARCIRHRIVSNKYLKKSFGGLLIPHVRDTDIFDPSLFDSSALRKQFDIDERKKVILFMGTPREHKGLDDLMSAFNILGIPSALLMIVGFDLAEESQRELYSRIKEKIGDRCLLLGQQPFESIPRILSMADVVVIPQQKTHSSIAQIPAKLFDAMAMAKPVIASNVNDIPEILKDCGLVYEAGNVEMLAQSLDKVLKDTSYAKTLGSRAREKCVAHYSYAAVREQIKELINSVVVRNQVAFNSLENN